MIHTAISLASVFIALVALYISQKSNTLAKNSNKIAMRGNELAQQANITAENANTIAERSAARAEDFSHYHFQIDTDKTNWRRVLIINHGIKTAHKVRVTLFNDHIPVFTAREHTIKPGEQFTFDIPEEIARKLPKRAGLTISGTEGTYKSPSTRIKITATIEWTSELGNHFTTRTLN